MQKKMDKGRGNTSNVLPLPPNVVQQWQLLQRALAVNKPSPSASQTQQLGPCGGGVSVQVLSSPGAAVSLPRTSVPTTSYTYKVRIINPSKKSDVVSRYLNPLTANGIYICARALFLNADGVYLWAAN